MGCNGRIWERLTRESLTDKIDPSGAYNVGEEGCDGSQAVVVVKPCYEVWRLTAGGVDPQRPTHTICRLESGHGPMVIDCES
jgi:hypothetical protein